MVLVSQYGKYPDIVLRRTDRLSFPAAEQRAVPSTLRGSPLGMLREGERRGHSKERGAGPAKSAPQKRRDKRDRWLDYPANPTRSSQNAIAGRWTLH